MANIDINEAFRKEVQEREAKFTALVEETEDKMMDRINSGESHTVQMPLDAIYNVAIIIEMQIRQLEVDQANEDELLLSVKEEHAKMDVVSDERKKQFVDLCAVNESNRAEREDQKALIEIYQNSYKAVLLRIDPTFEPLLRMPETLLAPKALQARIRRAEG